MSAQAARKRAADREYAIEKQKRYVRARGLCELMAPGCTQVATEAHHRIRRSHKLTHDADWLLAACHGCHQWAHLNVADAKSRGWIVTDWPQIV